MPRPCDHPTGPTNPDCKVCRKYVQSAAHRQLWGRPATAIPAKPVISHVRVGGPGTELKDMLRALGFPTCGKCAELADRMNAGGADWCRRNRQAIIDHLAEARKDVGWLDKLKASVLAITSGVVWSINPADTLGSLVDEAIRRGTECQPK